MMLDNYRTGRAADVAAHHKTISNMTAAEYQKMWYVFTEIGEEVPAEYAAKYAPLITVAGAAPPKTYTGIAWEAAKLIHVWINKKMETSNVCRRLSGHTKSTPVDQPCQVARNRIINYLQSKADADGGVSKTWCDARADQVACELENAFAPDGRRCAWVADQGCNFVEAPTAGLEFHGDHAKKGIFF